MTIPTNSDQRDKIDLELLWLSHVHTKEETSLLIDCVMELLAAEQRKLIDEILERQQVFESPNSAIVWTVPVSAIEKIKEQL